jgi:hypothetical protein
MFKCDTCCHLVSDHVGPNGQCLGVAGIPGCGCERYIKKPADTGPSLRPEDIRSKDYDSPAFPTHPYIRHDENGFVVENNLGSQGITMRDYFAAAAVPGLLPNNGGLPERDWAGIDEGLLSGEEIVALRAYKIADAMLNRRRL